jgi:cytochrome c-type biogenesis protein
VSTGLLLILLFAVGHCLPIVIAGSSTAAVRKVVENQSWQTGGQWFRRLAGVLIGMLGIYFIISPFVFS